MVGAVMAEIPGIVRSTTLLGSRKTAAPMLLSVAERANDKVTVSLFRARDAPTCRWRRQSKQSLPEAATTKPSTKKSCRRQSDMIDQKKAARIEAPDSDEKPGVNDRNANRRAVHWSRSCGRSTIEKTTKGGPRDACGGHWIAFEGQANARKRNRGAVADRRAMARKDREKVDLPDRGT